MFQGASEKLKNQDPIRVTNHKDPVSEETRSVLKNTKVWRMERVLQLCQKNFRTGDIELFFHFANFTYSQTPARESFGNFSEISISQQERVFIFFLT